MEERRTALASWGARAACGTSPLAAAYAGTLFHAVPSACVTIWTLVAWMRRDPERPRTDLIAGAAFALAFFTKFNYGLMLGAGGAAAWAWDGAAALRVRRLGPWLRASAWLAAVPALTFAWWVLLPLPEGAETPPEAEAALQGRVVTILCCDDVRA